MIDFKFFYEDPQIWIENTKKRGFYIDFERIVNIYEILRTKKYELKSILTEKNKITKQIFKLGKKTEYLKSKNKNLNKKILQLQKDIFLLEQELYSFSLKIPNIVTKYNFDLRINGKTQNIATIDSKIDLNFLLEKFSKKDFLIYNFNDVENFDFNEMLKNFLISNNFTFDSNNLPFRFLTFKKDGKVYINSFVKMENLKKEYKLFCEFVQEIYEDLGICNYNFFEKEPGDLDQNTESEFEFSYGKYNFACSSYGNFLSKHLNLKYVDGRKKYFLGIVNASLEI